MGLAISKHEEFWEACGFGHKEKVKNYLKSNVIDVNWKNNSHENSTALHLACQGKIDIIRILLEAGCDVNTKDNSGNLPIHFAAMNGHADIIELLLESGSEIDSQNANGWTPIINASYWCQSDCLKVLLKHNADIHTFNKDGRTALYEACRSPCKENGESLSFEDEDVADETALTFEARTETPSKTSRKVKFAMDTATTNGVGGVTALIGGGGDSRRSSVSDEGDKDYEKDLASIVQQLIEAGADVNGKGCDGQDDFTPLVFASYHGHNLIVSMLFKYSCDKSSIALQWANNKGNTEVCKNLEQHGITIDEKTIVKPLLMPPPLLQSQMPKKMSSSEFVKALLANGTTNNSTPVQQYRPQRRIPQALSVAPLPPSTPPPSTKRPTYDNIPSIDD